MVIPFDIPQQFANGVSLPVNSQRSIQFSTQYPVTQMTVSVAVAGVASPTADLIYSLGYTIDGTNYSTVTLAQMTSAGLSIGAATFPAATNFQLSVTNTNPANTAATVTAAVLIPRSGA